jgi:hypothetical protein
MQALARIAATAVFAGVIAVSGCTKTDPNTPPPASNTPTQVSNAQRGVIPAGQEIDVRLQSELSSDTAKTEQSFETTTVVNIEQDGRVLVPAGSTVRGVVTSASPAGRVDRTGKMTLSFDKLTVNGRDHEIKAMATNAFESGGIRDEATKVGAAGAAGAVIGGIVGGVKGALIGAAVGSGGVIAATEGKDVKLAPGTILRVRLDRAVTLRTEER